MKKWTIQKIGDKDKIELNNKIDRLEHKIDRLEYIVR